uniref:Uncharacterized protein n=1 Tax=Anguilla anguilla TaxID=7936 RepID=A0A0E9WZZ2_ANGAN
MKVLDDFVFHTVLCIVELGLWYNLMFSLLYSLNVNLNKYTTPAELN